MRGSAFVVLLPLAACADRQAADPEPTAAAVLAGGICEAIFECPCSTQIGEGGFADEAACLETYGAMLGTQFAAVEQHGGKVDMACAIATADRLVMCDPEPPNACALAVGDGAEGEACWSFFLSDQGTATSCLPGLLCIGGRCSPSWVDVEPGGSCVEPWQACSYGYGYCAERTKTCEVGDTALGEPCEDALACGDGLYCRGADGALGVCEERVGPGGECDPLDVRACRLDCNDDEGCVRYVCHLGACIPEEARYCITELGTY